MGAEPVDADVDADADADADQDADRFALRLRGGWLARWKSRPPPTYWLTRFAFLRWLAFIYLVAFASLATQLGPLIGSHGILPAAWFVDDLRRIEGSRLSAFVDLPSIFWLTGVSDAVMVAMCWIGLALSIAALAGVTNAIVQALLWFLYMSFVHIGQVWYGYGWEMLLLEAGFLSIFLCPLRTATPFPPAKAPPVAVVWMLRWVVFRLMVGAALIKLRGDSCWRDLTCLQYHYETQPNPSPLSWLIHQAPPWFHSIGVLFNHFVELVVPFFAFGPRRVRHVAGVLLVLFQVLLILSGNLSFLNWLTIGVCIACFDDQLLGKLATARRRARIAELEAGAAERATRVERGVIYGLAAVVLSLSPFPVTNMISSRQLMNASFDPLHLVNTYGAFGSVDRVRHEVILEGTSDRVLGPHTRWKEYELPCKPGDVRRAPCFITPWHFRLDWQMWFAALPGAGYDTEPWIVRLVDQLLSGNREVARLFARDPFPRRPPRFIRAQLYRYEFTRLGDRSDAWWKRRFVTEYLRPLSRGDPELRAFLDAHGWLR